MMSERATLMIREVQDIDCKTLTQFFEENNRPEITKYFHPFLLSLSTAYKIACESHIDRYYIAINNGFILGLCMLRGWDEGFDIPSFGILVDYRYQGHGIGKKMTEFTISEVKRLGCNAIRLSVYASNVQAVHLYFSLGFQEVFREFCVVAGEPDEKIVMVKSIKI